MTTAILIREISKLPWPERLLVIEKTLKSIRQDQQRGLTQAVESLGPDYAPGNELVAFTQLDADRFYEAR